MKVALLFICFAFLRQCSGNNETDVARRLKWLPFWNNLKATKHGKYIGAEPKPKRRQHVWWKESVRLRPSSTPRRIALAFHGHYDRRGTRFDPAACSNFFHSSSNINKRLIQPLRAIFEVDIYFHTYRHSWCRSKDAALVDYLQPVAYQFTDITMDGLPPKIIDSFVAVLELIFAGDVAHAARGRGEGGIDQRKKALAPDAIVLCRFDVVYHTPVTSLGIRFDRVTFSFRDTQPAWERMRKVSDLFTIIPASYAEDFQWALETSCCDGQQKRRICAKMKKQCESSKARKFRKSNRNSSLFDSKDACRGPICPGHFIYKPLSKLIGEESIYFIDGAFRSSNIETGKKGGKQYGGKQSTPFLALDRACSKTCP